MHEERHQAKLLDAQNALERKNIVPADIVL